ncbi:hypothetical protein FGB62_367g03 [Gracilaria domingensis]|nr:hypothetical protein FGB62_367g03 [Gracilaria domingensis]
MALPEGQESRLPPAYENHPYFVELRQRRALERVQFAGKRPLEPPATPPTSPPPRQKRRRSPSPSLSHSDASSSDEEGSTGDESEQQGAAVERGSEDRSPSPAEQLTEQQKRQLLKLRIRLPLRTCFVVPRDAPHPDASQRAEAKEGDRKPEERKRGREDEVEAAPQEKKRKVEHRSPARRSPVLLKLRVREPFGTDEDGFRVEPRRSAVLVQNLVKRVRRRRESLMARRRRRRPAVNS